MRQLAPLSLLFSLIVSTGTGCAGAAARAEGYLQRSELPDGVSLLPPPPPQGSAALARDQEASGRGLALRGTARWVLAAQDADLGFPYAAGAFSCALDAPVSAELTPHLYRLLEKSAEDAGGSTSGAKRYYARSRPFLSNNQPVCTPQSQGHLTTSGSYPSGHSAIGWSWALILAEISPERLDRILSRGRSFGESRVICNVHWLSDVEEGRTMAAATVSRLHAEEAFRADLNAAKSELAAVRSRGLKPQRDCAAERAGLEATH